MIVQNVEVLKAEGQLESLVLVDVRTPVEYQALHAKDAINIPLDEFSEENIESLKVRGTIALLCQGGTRAKTACQKLKNDDGVIVIEGGTQAWEAATLPVVEGKKTISLERQVRIAAGLLVFSGVCLGYFVHPTGLIVAGFVGVGLAFAGITDTCGMAILLSKCPWNKV